MRLSFASILTLTCLSLLGSACKDEPNDDNADEVGSESSSTDSGSTDSGSTDSGSTDSGSTDATDSDSTDPGSTDSDSTDGSSTDSDSTDSGSTDSGSTESTSESTTTESTTVDPDTTTGFDDCNDIEATYEGLVSDPANLSCDVDAECHVVDGHCWMGLGGCWYVVNQNLQQTDLELLADAYSGLGCFGPICLCLQPPDAVGCVDGTCAPL